MSLPLARLSSKKNFEKKLLLIWVEESAIISVKNYGLFLSVFVKYAPEINEKKTGQRTIINKSEYFFPSRAHCNKTETRNEVHDVKTYLLSSTYIDLVLFLVGEWNFQLPSEENVFRPQALLVPFWNFQWKHVRRYNEAKREKRPAASTGFIPSQREKQFLFLAIWKERVAKPKSLLFS